MAVIRSSTVYAQYITSGSSFDGILNGGDDYRTLDFVGSSNGINVGHISWNWDTFKNMSRACKITGVTVMFEFGGNNTSQPLDKGTVKHYPVRCSGISISGNTINGTFTSLGSEKSESFDKNSTNSGKKYASVTSVELSGVSLSGYIGYSDPRLGMHIYLDEGNNIADLKLHIRNLRATITYNSAAYVTFQGEGINTKTIQYDNGSTPSYGSTPTRSGYIFSGWLRGTTTYTGTLPTVGEYDVTYTAVWTPIYTVKYNGNGATEGTVASQNVDFGSDLTLRNNNYDKSYVVTLDNNYDPTQQRDSFTSTAFFLGWEDHGDIVSSNGRHFAYTEFDAPFYANTYGDLYAAFGYNKLSLVNHYVNNGQSEGRICIGSERGAYPEGAVVNSLSTSGGAIVELYAKWTKMSSIPLPSRTRSGYTFLGWFTEPTGGTRIGGGGDIYTPTGDILLYAHWQPESALMYIKKDGNFVAAKKVYMKKNGTWTEVADKSEINTDVKYTIKLA